MEKLTLCLLMLVVVTHAWDRHTKEHNHEDAPLGPTGEVIDTPEVAKAKEEHFEIVKDTIHHNLAEGDHHGSEHKEHFYRTDGHGNFYNVEGHFELVKGEFLPNTKAVEIETEKQLKWFHKIRKQLE